MEVLRSNQSNHLPINCYSSLVGFEDIFGGGDFDYNDVRLQVAGDIGVGQIPEPSAMILFAMGPTFNGFVEIADTFV